MGDQDFKSHFHDQIFKIQYICEVRPLSCEDLTPGWEGPTPGW